MTGTDLELLAHYRQEQAEAAFAEIVRRHLPLVFSAALRVVRSPALAEEVAQTTFTKLAREARQLAPCTILTAWLYRVARHEAVDVVRREARRQLREQVFTEMNATHSASDWNRIEPLLEEAMHALDEIDRTALLLRYFENKSLREVGAAMGTSDDAAQKRVSRAIAKLCEFFGKNGVTVGASGLAVLISAQAVQAAPLGLALAISTAALLATSSLAVSASATATKVLVMTAVQKALVIGCFVLLTGTILYTTNRPNPGPAKLAAVATTTNDNPVAKRTNQNGFFAQPKTRGGSDLPAHLTIAVAQLRAALKGEGTVHAAIVAFGEDRKEAFPILKEAANSPDMAVRQLAIQSMAEVGCPARPVINLIGDPSAEVKPYLWTVAKANNNKQISMFAYTTLLNCQVASEDIPNFVQFMGQNKNVMLKGAMPTLLVGMIDRDPLGPTPYLPAIRDLLQNPNFDVQVSAAAVLAKYEAAQNPDLLPKLIAGLKVDQAEQHTALYGLENMGVAAKPAVLAILEMADSTSDSRLRESALKTAGKIDRDLRNHIPEVDGLLRNDEAVAYWRPKLAAGNCSYQDLLLALKVPEVISPAATQLGAMGSSAKEAVPALISAMSSRPAYDRTMIEKAIQQIDPAVTIPKVHFLQYMDAASAASKALEVGPQSPESKQISLQLGRLRTMGSEWCTQQEVVEMANQIKAKDVGAYRAFVEKLVEKEPGMSGLFETAKAP